MSMHKSVAFAHALADETRWRIACLVSNEALCVCELADILELPQSTLSSHLQVMRKGGLVTAERCEKWAYYQLAREILPVWRAMRALDRDDTSSNRTLAGDRKKATARLALRGQTECKGPRRSIPPLLRARPRLAAAC
jgi:ArsR family transcriptional regulator